MPFILDGFLPLFRLTKVAGNETVPISDANGMSRFLQSAFETAQPFNASMATATFLSASITFARSLALADVNAETLFLKRVAISDIVEKIECVNEKLLDTLGQASSVADIVGSAWKASFGADLLTKTRKGCLLLGTTFFLAIGSLSPEHRNTAIEVLNHQAVSKFVKEFGNADYDEITFRCLLVLARSREKVSLLL